MSSLDRLARLRAVIEESAHLLPSQGPISVFIHHNTLHALESLPFDEALKQGARIYGCQPYLDESRYRAKLGKGRIRSSDLRMVLGDDLGDRATENIAGLIPLIELRLAMLQYPLLTGPTEELHWFMAETDALRRVRREASSAIRERLIAETRRWAMRDLRGGPDIRGVNGSPNSTVEARSPDKLSGIDRLGDSAMETWSLPDWERFTLQSLWRVCRDGVHGVADVPACAPAASLPVRHRHWLLLATSRDADQLVHEVLIPFCAAYLDQGLSHWRFPQRERGLLRCFRNLYARRGGAPVPWLHGLRSELRRLLDDRLSALTSIEESLRLLGVADYEWHDFIAATLLALRGWAGMIRQIEMRGNQLTSSSQESDLIEFLAIRLLLERQALMHVARQALDFHGPLCELRAAARRRAAAPASLTVEQRAFQVFQLAQVIGWTPEELSRLSRKNWAALLIEIEGFAEIERRRIFHLAYERRFYSQALDAIALHGHVRREHVSFRASATPRFQAIFCIDEREESIRRHLEEIAPDCETFGIAGFFFVPMYYRGAGHAQFVSLCPVGLHPRHWVMEQVESAHRESHQRRAWFRRILGLASRRFHAGSRAFAVGALLAAVFGPLASVPLVARTFAPRLTARLRRLFGRFVQASPVTRLLLERREDVPGPHDGHVGFSLDEMADIGERVLRDLGVTRLSRLVLIIGHGSTSLNNPHESAYNCGACGGGRGGPSARALASILNNPCVRERLEKRGLHVPADTVFIGGWHNTGNDTATFHDLDCLPVSHRDEFATARAEIDAACMRDAHERSRRFDSAPLTLSFAAAQQHVEGRTEDLAQVRPELGHATNALQIIGRRQWTRGLFLDRRAFLTSYDPTQDDAEGAILNRILQAVLPVCAGINLEYYFSCVDNVGWGSGTKLPHNITAMLGVMDGAASDLRTGLPWQMVEIHEPVRLLNIIETTPAIMLGIMDRNAAIGRLCRNGWVQVAVMDPQTRALSVFRNGRFESYRPQSLQLPAAASSTDWYRGWRDHLEFATIGA
ncbi:MAG: DUF2309 domain-containing protein [Planctomycetes bacterium]|nr:DUF2309 domain-containing protein [Planctomycetota bacterium]